MQEVDATEPSGFFASLASLFFGSNKSRKSKEHLLQLEELRGLAQSIIKAHEELDAERNEFREQAEQELSTFDQLIEAKTAAIKSSQKELLDLEAHKEKLRKELKNLTTKEAALRNSIKEMSGFENFFDAMKKASARLDSFNPEGRQSESSLLPSRIDDIEKKLNAIATAVQGAGAISGASAAWRAEYSADTAKLFKKTGLKTMYTMSP